MPTINDYRDRPHWSYSSLNQLLNICSLQWYFERVARLPRAFTPVALSFGSAYHRTLEWIYRLRMEGTTPKPADGLALFTDLWDRQVQEDTNVRFDEGETVDTFAKQGRDLVGCYLNAIDPAEQVVSVNEVLAVPVAGSERPLIGELDLVVRKDGQVIVTDQKTSARRWPKDQADKSLQPTVYLYAYQQQHGGELPPFRFDVVVKNKTPVFEQHLTRRTADDGRRLAALVQQAERLAAHECYYPADQSFYCSSCPYSEPCAAWHRQQARVSVRMAA